MRLTKELCRKTSVIYLVSTQVFGFCPVGTCAVCGFWRPWGLPILVMYFACECCNLFAQMLLVDVPWFSLSLQLQPHSCMSQDIWRTVCRTSTGMDISMVVPKCQKDSKGLSQFPHTYTTLPSANAWQHDCYRTIYFVHRNWSTPTTHLTDLAYSIYWPNLPVCDAPS